MPNRGGAGVAGDNQRVIRQPEKFVADVVQQILMIAARKIGASDALVKQHIARKQQLGGWPLPTNGRRLRIARSPNQGSS